MNDELIPALGNSRPGHVERLLLRPAEAAELLSISRTRAYEMIARGELPSVRLGASVRVPLADLRRHVEDLAEAS